MIVHFVVPDEDFNFLLIKSKTCALRTYFIFIFFFFFNLHSYLFNHFNYNEYKTYVGVIMISSISLSTFNFFIMSKHILSIAKYVIVNVTVSCTSF